MRKKPYLLLDAGGTLIFPNFELVKSLLSSKGIEREIKSVFMEFSRVSYKIDESLRDKKTPYSGADFIRKWMFNLNVPQNVCEELARAILEEDRKNGIWNYTFEYVKRGLELLKDKGYSMSVISNSDGRVEKLLEMASLRNYFDKVYDSKIVGVEKPSAGIYELALKELSIKTNEALYVGDMFYIDVLGANSCGIAAVHLDPFGNYEKWDGARIKDVGELPNFLENLDLNDNRLFPLSK